MAKQNFVVCVYLALSIIMVGCLKPPGPDNLQGASVTRMFEPSSQCEPPCWQNLVPGKTSLTESLEILKTIELIEPETIEVQDFQIERLSMDFQGIFWHFEHSSDSVVGYADYFDGQLAWIRFNPYGFLSLKDAMELYGEPERVFGVTASLDTKGVAIFLLYPSKGVILSYGFWEHFEDTVKIDPASRLGSVTYYDEDRWDEMVKLWVPSGGVGSDYEAWKAGMQLIDKQPGWEGFDYEPYLEVISLILLREKC